MTSSFILFPSSISKIEVYYLNFQSTWDQQEHIVLLSVKTEEKFEALGG